MRTSAKSSCTRSASSVSCTISSRGEAVEDLAVVDEHLLARRECAASMSRRTSPSMRRRDLVGVVGRAGEVATEEHLALRVAEAHRAERVAHAVLGDHLPGDRGGAVDVVLRAGGGVGEDQLLGGAPAEQHRELVDQLAARHEELVLGGQRERVPERAAARDDRDLVHRVGVGQRVRDQRVPALVVRDDALLALGDQPAPALGPGHHAVDGLFELRQPDELEVVAGREQRGFVHRGWRGRRR